MPAFQRKEGKRLKCPHCGSSRTRKAGKRRNKYVTKQGWRCKDCNRFFIERDGFEGMTYPKEIILEVLHLYVAGLSLSNIGDFMQRHRGYTIYESRILDWVRKYSGILKRFERRLKPKVKGRVHVDEVQLKVRRKNCYCIHAVDSGTKYNLELAFAERRNLEAFKEFFSRLKLRIGTLVKEVFRRERGKPPKERRLITFVSDKLGQIKRAFNAFFFRIARLVHGVPIACKRYGLRFNNNPIERHNEDIKQRYKVMRHSAEAFLTLRRMFYNFVRIHRSLGKRTPSDPAEIGLSLGENRFASLIALAKE